jgi:hypothetical protein
MIRAKLFIEVFPVVFMGSFVINTSQQPLFRRRDPRIILHGNSFVSRTRGGTISAFTCVFDTLW